MFNKAGILAMANAGRNTNESILSPLFLHHIWMEDIQFLVKWLREWMFVHKLENIVTDGRDMPMQPQKILKAYLK